MPPASSAGRSLAVTVWQQGAALSFMQRRHYYTLGFQITLTRTLLVRSYPNSIVQMGKLEDGEMDTGDTGIS